MKPLFIQPKYRQAAWLIALPVLILVIALIIAPYISAQGQDGSTPVQTLYHINTQAAYDGWTPELHRQAAIQYTELDDLHNAIPHWEAIASEDANAAEQLAQAYFDLGHWQASIANYTTVITFDPENTNASYALGLMLAASHPSQALEHLQSITHIQAYREIASELITVIETSTDEPALTAMRFGQVFARNELWPYAEQAFQYAAASSYAPLPEAFAYAGLARMNLGKTSDATISLARQLGGDSPQVAYVAGLYNRTIGDYAASRAAFSRAIQLDPINPLYYAELSSAYRLLLDYEMAEYWLRVAVAVSDNAPLFEQQLALFYAQEGYNLTDANLSAVQQTRGVLPPDPDLLAGFGWALHTAGDTAGALNEIEAALALAPENPQALFNKARILIATNDTQGATPLLRRVASGTSPFAETAASLLEELDNE